MARRVRLEQAEPGGANAQRDQDRHAGDEEVGRHGEERAALPDAAQVADHQSQDGQHGDFDPVRF